MQGHRERIVRKTGARQASSTRAAAHTVRFDTAHRARRYAKSLDERVEGADFVTRAEPGGGFAVVMRIAAGGGLSLTDLNVLERLGWPVRGE